MSDSLPTTRYSRDEHGPPQLRRRGRSEPCIGAEPPGGASAPNTRTAAVRLFEHHAGPAMTKLARACFGGDIALVAAQTLDMRIFGRPPSDTPVRALESVTHLRVPVGTPRAVAGYAVQSLLAPMAAVAARFAGEKVPRRFVAAALVSLSVPVVVNPALGASEWPSRWTRHDWTRELLIKSVLAGAVVAAL